MLSFLGQLNSFYIPSFRVTDIIEILIFIFVIYKVIIGLRNTRAMVLLKGILVLFIFYNLAYLFSFQVFLIIFQSVITLLLFALIVMFAPEMRKFIEQIGTQNLIGKLNLKSLFSKEKQVFKYYSDKSIVELSKSCFAMGEVKTGALIVIERNIPLTEYIDTGILVNADLSSQLLINIFEKNTPLHDGAVIQTRDKVVAATCYLPLSENPKIDKHMGTRHRAAIGISEATDCIVIVVSEETGSVSMAVDGKIQYNLTKEDLTALLYQYQVRKEVLAPKIEKNKLSIKSVFSGDDVVTRILSVVLGVMGWLLIINVANPITSVVIDDVPIEFINTSVIESTGKTFEIVSDEFVSVEVTERRSIVEQIRAYDISVVADLSKLSYVNAVPLSAYVDSYPTVKVEFVEDSTITVNLDSIISKEFNIELEKIESSNSNTFVPVLNSSVETVVITGGKSIVDTIGRVVYSYDVADAVGEYKGLAVPTIYDKNGNVLSNDLFTFNIDEVEATGIAYEVKEIPLEVNISENSSIDGYSISSLEFNPERIKVAGDKNYLESINKLVINTYLNISSESISNNQYIKALRISEYLPEGVYFADTQDELNVILNFEEYKTKTISFMRDDVSVKGQIEDYQVKLVDDNFSIIVSGEDSVLDKLSKDTIIPYIDVSDLTEGQYNLIMQFDGLDDVVLTSNISVRLLIEKN